MDKAVKENPRKAKLYCVVCGKQIERVQMPSGKWTTSKTCSKECLTTLLSERNIKRDNKQQRTEAFISRFNNTYYGRYEYVSGYEHSESRITCRCMKCGAERTVSANCVRHVYKTPLMCLTCKEKERRAEEEERKRVAEEQERKRDKERKKRAKKRWAKRLSETPKYCAECGKVVNNHEQDRLIIETTLREIEHAGITASDLAKHLSVSTSAVYKWKEGKVKPRQIYIDTMRDLIGEPIEKITNDDRSKYCSNKCRIRARNRRHTDHRRKVIRANGKAEWDITLKKLVARDKHVCYICGRKVNTRAHYNADDYGSIDHVIPLSKGGTHTWDNVRLAHRKCNCVKRDGMILSPAQFILGAANS